MEAAQELLDYKHAVRPQTQCTASGGGCVLVCATAAVLISASAAEPMLDLGENVGQFRR